MRKQIIGYEGKYEITDDGLVISIKRKARNGKPIGGRVLRGGTYPNGYKYVILRDDYRKDTRAMVHRLVAQAFIPNPKNLPCVNHLDGNKQNNSIDNLEWCTHIDNVRHAIRTGLVEKVCKIERQVTMVLPTGNTLKFDTMLKASEFFGFTKCWLGNYIRKHGNPCIYNGHKITVHERGENV